MREGASGLLAGLAGLLTYLVIHHFWIRPIWFVLPLGLGLAGLGGAAVGWSYRDLRPALPPSPWRTPAWTGLILALLLPAVVLAEIRPPLFDISLPEAQLTIGPGRVALYFTLELLLTASLGGGIVGMAHRRQLACSPFDGRGRFRLRAGPRP